MQMLNAALTTVTAIAGSNTHANAAVQTMGRYICTYKSLIAVAVPGKDSGVLLIPARFLQKAFLSLSQHKQLQHLGAVNADVK